jgi:hypothetical protein
VKPISAGFLRSLSGSHRSLARIRVVTQFQTGTNPTGPFIDTLDGTVTLDASDQQSAAVRSSADVTVDGTKQWPIFAGSLLAPYGNELFIERGIEFSDDTVEYTKLGYFRIQAPDQSGLSYNPIRVTCVDRMQAIIDGKLIAPVQFLPGASVSFIMTTLITDIYPAAVIEFDTPTTAALAITRSLIADGDRFKFLDDLITSLGKIWYWDYRGVLVVKSPPTPTNISYEVNHGVNGTLVDFSRALTRENTFNAVVASGEAADTGTPVRAVAIDASPSSPTYFFGKFGKVPMFYSNPAIITTQQAQSAALALLNRYIGLPYTINFGTIVNPALEPFDAVRVKYSHQEAQEDHVLSTVTIPLLSANSMTAKTREQRLVLAKVL